MSPPLGRWVPRSRPGLRRAPEQPSNATTPAFRAPAPLSNAFPNLPASTQALLAEGPALPPGGLRDPRAGRPAPCLNCKPSLLRAQAKPSSLSSITDFFPSLLDHFHQHTNCSHFFWLTKNTHTHTHSAIHPSSLSSYTPFLKPRTLRSAPLTSAPSAQPPLRPLQTGSLLHFTMPATLAKVSRNAPDPPFSGHTV